MRKRFLVAWAYLVEIVLSSVLLALFLLVFGKDSVVHAVQEVAPDVSAYIGGAMFAASLALFWNFYSKSDTAFMQWLHAQGAYPVYLRAFQVAIAIYAGMLIAGIATKHMKSEAVALVAGWSILLGIVNIYTLVKNVSGMMRLNAEFNRQRQLP